MAERPGNPTGSENKHETGVDHGTAHVPQGQRPFAVLGLQQVALGGLSKAALGALWTDKLGIDKVGEFRSETENVDEDILAIGEGRAKVEIDLMQPLDPEKRPRVHAPPLNHIGLWVDDLDAAYEWLSAQGVRFAPGGFGRAPAGIGFVSSTLRATTQPLLVGRGC